MIGYHIKGLDEFERAIRRNPQYVKERGGLFITRGLAEYRRIILREPWKRGASGGGAPVATGNLRGYAPAASEGLRGPHLPDGLIREVRAWRGRVTCKRNYQLRPWLDYAAGQALPEIERHEQQLFDDIMKAARIIGLWVDQTPIAKIQETLESIDAVKAIYAYPTTSVTKYPAASFSPTRSKIHFTALPTI